MPRAHSNAAYSLRHVAVSSQGPGALARWPRARARSGPIARASPRRGVAAGAPRSARTLASAASRLAPVDPLQTRPGGSLVQHPRQDRRNGASRSRRPGDRGCPAERASLARFQKQAGCSFDEGSRVQPSGSAEQVPHLVKRLHGEYEKPVGSALGQPARRPPERLERRGGAAHEVDVGPPDPQLDRHLAGHRAGRGVREVKRRGCLVREERPVRRGVPGGAHVQDTRSRARKLRLRETGVGDRRLRRPRRRGGILASLAGIGRRPGRVSAPSRARGRARRAARPSVAAPGHHPPARDRADPPDPRRRRTPQLRLRRRRLTAPLPSPAPGQRCSRQSRARSTGLPATARSSPCSARSRGRSRGRPRQY